MRYHLDHTPKKTGIDLNHSHKILMIGSCFAENIGNYLKENRFKTYVNPHGILFNPSSINNCLDTILQTKPIDEKYILERDNIFFSYHHHSSVHDARKHELIKKINLENKKAQQFLKEANYLVLTFGSAYVYRHLELDANVSNCHKQSGTIFQKHLLAVENIVNDYTALINDLQHLNPDLKIIFTVSPVKYLKDGVIENNLSKSTLLLSIHQLVERFVHCSYFPAYELVTDDLRDYRFYKEDLAHPNEQAIQYIWEKFSNCYLSEETKFLNSQITKLNLALNHRSLIHNSAEALRLNDYIIKQKEVIKKLNANIQV